MRVLVTGSNGCVGRALKSLCENDKEWIFINRGDCNLENLEMTKEVFCELQPIDYIVHLASYVPGFYNINKVASITENVRINENVLEASLMLGVKRGLFGLSVNMFPDNPSTFPMDESMILEGSLGGNFAGYAYSKRLLAMQCQNYNSQYGTQYTGIIPCNIYGPNDNLKSGRLIPNLIGKFQEAIKNKSDVVINGSGKPLRQFIYSLDLANIIKYLVSNYHDTKPIICCSDVELTIADLAIQIGQVLDFKHQIIFDSSKPDGVLKKTVSNHYLKTIMPQVSFTTLKEGLEETIRSMESL